MNNQHFRFWQLAQLEKKIQTYLLHFILHSTRHDTHANNVLAGFD